MSGYCLELSAEGLPFAPFTGVLRDLVRELGADGVAALLPGQGARELARLLPELGEPGIEGDPGEARARMFGQLLALFGRLAEAGPVVLVIEDAHWSDPSTRDLLAFLIGNQQALDGVLIVVTFRSDELQIGGAKLQSRIRCRVGAPAGVPLLEGRVVPPTRDLTAHH